MRRRYLVMAYLEYMGCEWERGPFTSRAEAEDALVREYEGNRTAYAYSPELVGYWVID